MHLPYWPALNLQIILIHPQENEIITTMDLKYPKTRKQNVTDTYFGIKVDDPYRWLEDDNAPETKAWVEDQNKVTESYLSSIPFRKALKNRLTSLVSYTRYSGAFQKKGKVYFYRNNGLQNQSVLYVQSGPNGTPRMLLDPNTFSTDGTTVLTDFIVSQNGRYAAFGQSSGGSDWNVCKVIDITAGTVLPETLEWLKFGIGAVWLNDDGFYYSRYPKPAAGAELTAKNVDQKVYFHKVGTSQDTDELVYEDTANPDRTLTIDMTDDRQYEVLYTSDPGKRGNGLFVRPVGNRGAFIPVVAEITEDSFTVIDTDQHFLLVLTNHKAPNQRVLRVDPTNVGAIKNSKVVIGERSENIESIVAAGGSLVVSYIKDVTSNVVQFDKTGRKIRDIKLPGIGSAGFTSGDRDDTHIYYSFTSYNYPSTQLHFDLKSGKSTVFKAPVIKDFKPSDYDVEQVFFKSKDGTKVPMFVVAKRGIKRDSTNPTLLYGYGGFNIPLTPGFSTMNLAWLEQGGIYVVVNLRGGSEYGERWHEAGMRIKKQNVFDDCIAAAEWLIDNKLTRPGRLALQGGSNGGLLVGAVINQRPDLFAVAIPQVGVMDMLRYQLFTAGKYWTAEYGSSEMSKKDVQNLLKFSPIHNIRKGQVYPAVMVTTADHDDRVVPAHSFKYASTLQEKASHKKPLLIRIETKSGHGSSNLSKAIEETSDVYAFLFKSMDFKPKVKGS
jgi:prolyl oligopeptidase